MAGAGAAQAQSGPVKKVHYTGAKPTKTPLFSGAVSYGNLLFIAGKGAHVPGDVKKHTEIVLKEIEKELVNAGSSMEKVLKVSVFLNDINAWAAMNEVSVGRSGTDPPVRPPVAPAGGTPVVSFAKRDVIPYIKKTPPPPPAAT